MATIYADNAATTQMSRAAIDAMLPYLETIPQACIPSAGRRLGRCSARATASQNA